MLMTRLSAAVDEVLHMALLNARIPHSALCISLGITLFITASTAATSVDSGISAVSVDLRPSMIFPCVSASLLETRYPKESLFLVTSSRPIHGQLGAPMQSKHYYRANCEDS